MATFELYFPWFKSAPPLEVTPVQGHSWAARGAEGGDPWAGDAAAHNQGQVQVTPGDQSSPGARQPGTSSVGTAVIQLHRVLNPLAAGLVRMI